MAADRRQSAAVDSHRPERRLIALLAHLASPNLAHSLRPGGRLTPSLGASGRCDYILAMHRFAAIIGVHGER